MHVSVLGAGALGRAYAAELSRMGCPITLVRRAPSSAEERFDAERLGLRSARSVVVTDSRRELPAADVLLVTLRADSVNEALIESLSAFAGPVVVLTPMFDAASSALWQRLPNVVFAMPNLLAWCEGDRVSYWVPPLSCTLLDQRGRSLPAVQELAARLRRAGVGARFSARVDGMSSATTLAFFPLQMVAAVSALGIERWHEQPELVRATSRALRHARRAAERVGRVEFGIRIASWLLGSPIALAMLSRWGMRLLPGAARYLNRHFGAKVADQTRCFQAHLAPMLAGDPAAERAFAELEAVLGSRAANSSLPKRS